MYGQVLAAVAALSAAVLAAPTEPKSFIVSQVDTGKKVFLNGPADVAKTHLKYAGTAPDNVVAAAAALQSGSVTATPQSYDSEYLCPVTIGTPGKTLNLDFDTGSSDLWVFSSLQPSSQQSGHNIYTPGSSYTSKALSGETWKISYGDGSGAKGVVYSDKVVIGGVTATTQDVEAATSVSASFVSDSNDGLVGLAFDNINTCSAQLCPTFLNTIQSSLQSPLFTSSLKKGKAGTYDFGYIDSSKYTGAITYTYITTAQGFWEFTASGYQVGSGSTVSTNFDSIADTGTTLIYMPDSLVSAYYASVRGAKNSADAGGWVFPCSATLPSLSFIIGGSTRTVPGTYINYAPYYGSTCFGGLQSSAGIGFNILGDIFLKSQFVVWNFGANLIGFATPTS